MSRRPPPLAPPSLLLPTLQSQLGPTLTASLQAFILRSTNTAQLSQLLNSLITRIDINTAGALPGQLSRLVEDEVQRYPFRTAFIVLGILLLVNPTAMGASGFGMAGPVMGALGEFVRGMGGAGGIGEMLGVETADSGGGAMGSGRGHADGPRRTVRREGRKMSRSMKL